MEDKENTKENLDSKDQKNFSEPQKPKITDQSQANNIQKIKEPLNKININSININNIRENKNKSTNYKRNKNQKKQSY